MKKEKGIALIIVLTLLFFLSLIGLGSYYIGFSDSKISYNVILSNKLFNAAENSISVNIENWGEGKEELIDILNLSGNNTYHTCLKPSGFINSVCNSNLFYTDGTLKSYSETKISTNECLSYGNTDHSVNCYRVRGVGELSVYPFNKISNVQEIKIKTININNNGVYEF